MQEAAARSTRSRLAFGASPRERVGAVWRRNGALAFFLGLEVLCFPALALAQAIKPDGRTATTVTTVGAVTKVTTATVSNANAFNSFQSFSVGAGTTANLYVPNGATNLINIVRDQRTDIYGVLNAIKNGQIGGNVWFANPNGFLVGASGVVNVGSLTVSTPTPAFIDGFFSSPGTPNQASVTQLLNGAAPRNASGVITIDGRINAVDGVSLSAGSVLVGGSIYSGARFVGSAPDFTDVVNANGIAVAANTVIKDGRIVIVADNDVTVSGTIAAPGGAGVPGGSVSIAAGHDVDVQPGALISAQGSGANSAGGSISIFGGNNATFASGAAIDASAGTSGDGGAIEFSAVNTVSLAGGTFAAGAANGRAGSVLVDPNNIEVVSNNQILSGTNYSLIANNSITVNSGVIISTRNIGASTNYDTAASIGNSGDILLTAPSIALKSGSKLLAQADGGFQGGAVTLTATQTNGGTAQINLSQAEVKGRSVSLQASSTLTSTLSSVTDALVLSGINSSDATASIVIDSSQIAASGGALTLGSVASVNVSATSASIPLAILRVNSNASVDVKGSSSLTTTTPAGDAHLTASSIVTTNATPSSAFANMAGDGMVAVSAVTSNATVHVGDPVNPVTVNIGGLLDLSATNTVTTTQIANATAAGGSAAGASVAVSTITGMTSATIDGNTTVGAGSLNLSALTANTVTDTATSAAQGAQQDTSGTSESSQMLAKYKDDTNTADSGSSGGGVKVAGAVAVSDLQNATQAYLASSQLATVSGAATLTSRATNSAAVSADGSATSGSTGVGVAVAVNVAKSTNQAFVGQNLSAQSLALTAGMNPGGATNQFTTTAVSGAGASSVGVAGSIAVNALDLSSAATINSGFTVTIASGGTGDVSLSAENLSSSSASSTPAAGTGGASGSKVGIGAAVAVNVVSNRTTAEIQDTAQLNGADDLTLKASGADTVTTTAEAGASGGTAITPVAAINVVNNTTTARIGTSVTTLALTGDLLVQADQAASASASAKGSTQGASAAIGAAVAVALVDDEVSATTARWIDTSTAAPGKGNVSFLAHGASASSTSATASAAGGKSDDQSSSDDGDVDTKVGKQLGAGTSVKSKNGVGDASEQGKDASAATDKPSASSSEGKISVAAAVAVNLQTSSATATVPDSGNIHAKGLFKLSSSNNTDGSAITDGSAVGSAAVGIGAGISINLVKSANEASIGQTATVNAHGVALEALMTPIGSGGADLTNMLDAEAKSGAGGSKVGLAGSLALNIADTSSQALIESGAQVDAGGGAVSLSADDRTSTTGKALPSGPTTGAKVGIGASVAVNVVANRSTAEIQDTAQLTTPGNVTLKANGAFAMDTETEAGSSGGVSITPSVAISLASNSTTARIGTSTTGLTLTGDLLVQADQTSSTTTTAKGSSQGAKAAIGAAVAVALVDDEVTATTARALTANGTGNVSFLAHGASASSASATASAVGGKTDDDAGATDPATGKEKEDASVDDKVSKQADFGKKEQTDNNVGDSKQKASTADADSSKPSASSSEGKISVAAAVSVNLQTSSATATVPDSGNINAAGLLKLSSSNNTDGTALTDGSAVGSTTTLGIGAGVSVNLVKSVNEASIGASAQVSAHGVTLEALMTPIGTGGSDVTNTLDAEAKSGAGGSKVGLAGSLALNIADTSSQALIKTGTTLSPTTVNANGGTVSLTADDQTSTTGKALPSGPTTGGKVGIGASVAVNVVANRSTAEIQDNAQLNNSGSLTLKASGTFAMDTETEAGSQGGISITPSVAISLANNTTTARIGASATALTLTGDLLVQTDQTSTTTTTAKGSSQGAKAAIGAAVAVALVDDEVAATTARAITANGTGNVSFLAHGASASSASATASAVGGNTDDDAGKTDPATGKEKEDASVDDKVQKQSDFGKDTQASNNVGDSKQQATTADTADNNKASASSSEGKISVAAAVSVNLQTSSATATVPDGGKITAAGLLKLSSSNNTDGAALTDGSAVGSTTTLGIGAGISVNLVKSVNEASIGQNATVTAKGVTLEALMTATPVSGGGTDQTNTMDAEAKSGAGGTKVGLAGSLALNIIDTSSQALIKSGAAVNAGTGDVSLTASGSTSVTAKALPADAGGASGGKVGIGASVAVNVVANRSTAEIQDTAQLTFPGNVGLGATGVYAVDTEAEAGATGGVAITPVLALALVNNTTSAHLGTGNALLSPGTVTLTADHTSTTTTSAKGSTQGDKAAVGAAVGIVLLNDVASATTDRNILTATGDVTISAHASSASTNSAIASAVGGKSTDDAGTTDPATGKPSEDSTVDSKVDNQLTYGKNTQTANNVGDADQKSSTSSAAGNKPSAKSDEGQVAVAAAVAVNIVSASATATIADNRTVTTSGALKLSATGNTDGIATSDGSVVGKTQKVGIGAAVSVNKVDSHNEASIGSGASVTAHGVTLEANMTNFAGDTTNTLDAEASSGAGGSKVGIAASLALNIADTSGKALIKSGASVNAGSDVSLTSEDFSIYTAKAAPTTTGGASGGSVGVGASVALNLITSASQAQIGTGAGVTNAGNITLSATTKGDSDAEATAGASGGKLAFDAAVAVTTLSQSTDASIASGGDISATGNVGLTSTSSGAHTATTTGVAKSGSVAIGASVGVITSTSSTTATIDRNVAAGGTFTLAASSTRSYDAGATATAGGSQSDSTYSDSSNQTQEGGAASTQALSKQNSSTNQGTQGGGKVAVAAAVSVIVIDDDATAQVTGGRTIQAGSSSAVQVTATNLTNFSARGEGDAVNPQAKVGVGIGVGIVIANNDTTAALADNTHLVQGGNVTVQATSKENTDPSFSDKLSAEGIAGAGGSKVGVAGAFAVVDSNTTTQATIGTGSTLGGLDSHSVLQRVGAVTIDAENTSMLAAKAWSGALGGTAGVGASVATVISDNSYTAELGGSGNVTATSLSITAQNNKVLPAPLSLPSISVSSIDDVKGIPGQLAHGKTLLGGGNYYTEAIAGSAGGTGSVAGSFAVSVFTDKTDASIGGGATVNATGAVALTSSNDTVARSLAGGVSLGGDAGVGISSADVASTNVTRSRIDADARITQSASIGLSATNKQDIQVIGFAAAGSGSVGVGGVANVITLNNTAEAFVANSTLATPLTLLSSTGALTLGATNTVTGLNVASGIAVGGSAGVGVAGAVNTLGTDSTHQFVTHAYIGDGATANAAAATALTANATEDLTTFAIGGAAGGSAGVGGAAVVNVMNTDTSAHIGAGAKVNKAQTLTSQSVGLQATDTTSLFNVVGAAGVGGSAGVGASADVDVLSKSTQAYVGNGSWVETAGNLTVQAASSEDLRSIALGFGAGGSAGVAGSVAVYSLTTTTKGYLDDNSTLRAKGSALISADDTTSLDLIAGSAAGGGSAAVGAGVGVTVFSKTTQAYVGNSADVVALGNGSAVTAATGDFNVSTGSTISGAGEVSDSGVTATDPNNNNLTGTRSAFTYLTKQRVSAPVTSSVNGLAIAATNRDKVESFTVTGAAAGAAAVTIGGSVAVVTTDTEASIGSGTQVNQASIAGSSASGAQSVRVAAGDDQFHVGLGGAAAGAGAAAIGAGADVMVAGNTTKATIGANAQVKAKRDVEVLARSQEQYLEMGAGLAAAGTVAIAGSVGVISLNDKTYASIVGGTTRVDAGGNVRVAASDNTETDMIAGAAAAGFGAAGVGVAVGVNSLTKDTQATIGDSTTINALGGSGASALTAYTGDDTDTAATMHGLQVQATSKEDLFLVTASGAAGLYAGVSGAVTVTVVNSNTLASIGNTALINTTNGGAATDQDVNVSARNQLNSQTFVGSVGIGAAGVAGGVDVLTAKNNTTASVGTGTEVHALRDVDVNALSKNQLSTLVVSAGGGVVGVAGGVAVYSIGDKLSSDSQDQLTSNGDVKGQADSQASDGTLNSLLSQSSDQNVKNVSASAQSKRSAISTSGAVTSGPAATGNSASIGSGARVFAGGDVSVNSRGTMNFSQTTGAVAVGLVGLGAGIGIAHFNLNNQASVGANAEITAGDDVKVRASLSETANGLAFAGSGGVVAVNAALAILSDSSTTTATIGNGVEVHHADQVDVEAGDVRKLDTQALGASFGAVAGGASVATTSIGGTTSATIGSGIGIGAGPDVVNSLFVSASSSANAASGSIAAAGGIGLALSGSAATASSTPIVSASVGGGTVNLTGDATIQATGRAGASADAEGFNISLTVSAGGSVATATSAPQISASLGTGTTLTSDNLSVSAAQLLPTSLDVFSVSSSLSTGSIFTPGTVSGVSTLATATGASAALFAGVTATSADAANNGHVTSSIGDGSTLTVPGLLSVSAENDTNQSATVSGLSVGIVAIGSNNSSATSNTVTHATLGDNVNIAGSFTGGSISILATGTDTDIASAVSGSGGIVSGAAASANTSETSDTLAQVGASTCGAPTATCGIASGSFGLVAQHDSVYNAKVDSTSAAVAGASGATTSHFVQSTVNANIGNNSNVSANNIAIAANNASHKFWWGLSTDDDSTATADNAAWNVNSGSGGLINLPAGSTNAQIAMLTGVSIGQGDLLHVMMPASGSGSITVDANNTIVAYDKTKLDSGGLIALAESDSILNVAQSIANVTIGANATIISDSGNVNIGTRADVKLDARATANAYGLAGAPSGQGVASYNGSTTVHLNNGVVILAQDPGAGAINISAGEDSQQRPSSIIADASVNLWNKTVIPIDSDPDPHSTVVSNATLQLDGSTPANQSLLLAAGDIGLNANKGVISQKADGVGKDLYKEAIAAIANAVGVDVSLDLTGGTTSLQGQGTVLANGTALSGLYRESATLLDGAPLTPGEPNGWVLTASAYRDPTYKNPNPRDTTHPFAYITFVTPTAADVPAGTQLQDQINSLNQLAAQYSADPVASAAYNAEITFLQSKLNALGAGQNSSTLTDRAIKTATFAGDATAVLNNYQYAITGDIGASTTANQIGAVGAILNAYGTIKATNSNIDTALRGEVNIPKASGAFDPTNAGYVLLTNDLTSAATQVSTIKTQVGNIGNLSFAYTAGGATPSGPLGAYTATTVSGVSTVAGSGYLGTIQTDMQGIGSILFGGNSASNGSVLLAKVNDIKTQMGSIATANQSISSALYSSANPASTSTLYGALTDAGIQQNHLATTWKDTSTNKVDDATVTSISGAVTTNNGSSLIGSMNGGTSNTSAGIISTNASGFTSCVTTSTCALLVSGTTTGATINLAADQLAVQGGSDTVSQQQQRVATLPSISVKLGNVNVNADVLTGSGSLQAPGDAKIIIRNLSPASMNIGQLTVDDTGGNVTFNSYHVNSAGDVQAVNAGGAGDTLGIVSRANGLAGLDRVPGTVGTSVVQINSFYDPAQFSKTAPTTAEQIPAPAPEIHITNQISNPNGSVAVTSAAGDIFVDPAVPGTSPGGSITAGQVSITAQNGDFVQAFQNGFDSVSGEPINNVQGGSNNTSPGGTLVPGNGILANGNIFISARYLNINGLVQSGIANYHLNLGTDTDLRFVVNGLPNGFSNTLRTSCAALTACTATSGAFVATWDGAYRGIDGSIGRWEVNKAYVDANFSAGSSVPVAVENSGGAGVSAPSSPDYGAIAANYIVPTSGQTGQIVLATTTAVHGGSINLFGQIINTAPGGGLGTGQLNVLDGFGQVAITNNSSLPITLKTLDTGADPSGTGRGTAGVINIADVQFVDTSNVAHYVDTRITRNNGAITYTQTGEWQSNGSFCDACVVQASGPTTAGVSVNGTGSAVGIASARSGTYDPQAGLRYAFTTGDTVSTVYQWSYSGHEFFGSSDLALPPDRTSMSQVGPPNVQSTNFGQSGVYLSYAAPGGFVAHQNNLVTDPGFNPGNANPSIPVPAGASSGVTSDTGGTAGRVRSTTVTYTNSDTWHLLSQSSSCDWWLCITSTYTSNWQETVGTTHVTTNSVKADNPIQVNFIGQDVPSVSVKSKASVVLAGPINDRGGATTITAGVSTSATAANGAAVNIGSLAGQSIGYASGSAAPITAGAVTLSASGSVGAVNFTNAPGSAASVGAITTMAPILLAMTPEITVTGGVISTTASSLNASAGTGNVAINQVAAPLTVAGGVTQTAGTLAVGTISAGGQPDQGTGYVLLQSQGDIAAASPSSFIRGERIELTSVNGSIGVYGGGGVTAAPLMIQPGYNTGASTQPYYGLKVSAQRDINIGVQSNGGDNTAGNLLVDTVVGGGNVRLAAPGQIIDNNPIQSIDTRTWNQLVHFWDSLGLTPGAQNTANQAKAIQAYDNSVTQDYQVYWQIRSRQPDPAAFDPNFQYTVTPAERAALTAQGMSASNISNFEANRTAQYLQLNTEVGGFTTTFQHGFAYDAIARNDPQVALILQGSSWTTTELGVSIPGALKNITNTNPVIKDPNVQGRNVDLQAGISIGQTQAPLVIPTAAFSNPDPNNCAAGPCLTDADKVALASAEFDDLTVSSGGITVLQRKPLNFAAATSLSVAVTGTGSGQDNGNAYLASLGDGLLNSIQAPGEVRVKVGGSIINAGTGVGVTPGLLQAGGLILEASGGGIGFVPNFNGGSTPLLQPLLVNLNPGAAFTARAADNVSVVQTGNLNVESVFSRQDVALTATGSITDAVTETLPTLKILADSVTLSALNGSIGSPTNSLDVAVAPTGTITASATSTTPLLGGVYLNNPTGPINGNFTIASVTASDAVKLSADLDMKIDGPVTSPGTIGLVSGGTMTLTPNANVHATVLATSLNAGELVMDAGAKVAVDIGNLNVNSSSTLTMADGATLTVNQGTINITTVGDAVVTGIFTGNPTASAINIISTAGHILAGHTLGTGDMDIIADTAPGAKLTMSAALGIGDEPLNVQLLNLQAASGGVVDVAAQGPLNSATVQAADRVLLTATGSIGGGTVTSTGTGANPDNSVTVTSTTGNVNLTNVAGQATVAVTGQTGVTVNSVSSTNGGLTTTATTGNVNVTTASAGQGAAFNAPAGSVNVTTGTAGADVTLAASGNVSGGTLTSTAGNVNASSSAGNVNVSTANANQGATFTATTGNVNVNSGTAGGNLTLTGAAGVTGTTLTSTGGNVNASSSGGNVDVSTANANQGATFTASTGNTSVNSGTTGGNLTLTGAAGVTGTTLTSTGGNVNASSSGGNVDLGTTTAGQGVTFSAPAGTATAATTNAGTTINGSSGQGITIGSATSGGNTTLATGGDLNATTLTSTGGSVTGNATGDVTVATGSASGGFTLASATGNVDASTVTANSVALSAPGSVTGGTLNVGSNVQLSGDLVTANVVSGGPVISGSITGFNGGTASNVNLTLSSPSGFALDSFSTATGSVNVPAGFLTIDSVVIVDRATFTNPSTSLLVDQHDRSIQSSDVQLYTGGAPFSLGLAQNHVDTDSFVIFRDSAFEVVTPFITNKSSDEQASDAQTRIDAGRPPSEHLPFENLGDVISYSGVPVSVTGDCQPETDPGCAR